MLVRCNCSHAGQDALHGAGVRVANELARKDSGPLSARCSVCGAIHAVRTPDAPTTKKDRKAAAKAAAAAK